MNRSGHGVCVLILFVITLAARPAAAGVLSKFDETRITVEAHRGLDRFGMTNESVRGHVAGWLRLNLPQLAVKDTVAPFIHVSVLIQETSNFVHGYLSVRIVRKVTINDLDLVVSGGVWQTGGVVVARLSQTEDFVLQSLDELLTKFANQWKRDNP